MAASESTAKGDVPALIAKVAALQKFQREARPSVLGQFIPGHVFARQIGQRRGGRGPGSGNGRLRPRAPEQPRERGNDDNHHRDQNVNQAVSGKRKRAGRRDASAARTAEDFLKPVADRPGHVPDPLPGFRFLVFLNLGPRRTPRVFRAVEHVIDGSIQFFGLARLDWCLRFGDRRPRGESGRAR